VARDAQLYPCSRVNAEGDCPGQCGVGHGHYQGLVEGRRQGAAIGAAGATVVVAGAAFVYRKLKASRFTKRDEKPSAEDSNLVIEEGVRDEPDADEGATSA
jgi:hypothetical protein